MRDAPEKFSRLTIALHWLVGLTIIAMVAVGLYMTDNDAYNLYPIHKSTGILLFTVVLIRVIWRVINGWPTPVSRYQAWEHNLAKVVHWVLIIGTVLMPISGMMMSGAGGHGLNIYGLELLAVNHDPANPGDVIALNGGAAELGHETHEIVGKIMIGAILLHIAGALKHHFIDKDGTLRRMLGSRISTAV
jgi:cytochrome b561